MSRSGGSFASLKMTGITLALLSACKKEAPPVAYQALPVERRDIVVSAQASASFRCSGDRRRSALRAPRKRWQGAGVCTPRRYASIW